MVWCFITCPPLWLVRGQMSLNHLVVVEDRPPHMIVKRFGCTTIHKKRYIKCIIHSFIHSFINKADSPHDSTEPCATKLFTGPGGLGSRLITRSITVPPACLRGESSYWPPPPSIPIYGPPLQSLHSSQPSCLRWQRTTVHQGCV